MRFCDRAFVRGFQPRLLRTHPYTSVHIRTKTLIPATAACIRVSALKPFRVFRVFRGLKKIPTTLIPATAACLPRQRAPNAGTLFPTPPAPYISVHIRTHPYKNAHSRNGGLYTRQRPKTFSCISCISWFKKNPYYAYSRDGGLFSAPALFHLSSLIIHHWLIMRNRIISRVFASAVIKN